LLQNPGWGLRSPVIDRTTFLLYTPSPEGSEALIHECFIHY
jgi:hypothetical protein